LKSADQKSLAVGNSSSLKEAVEAVLELERVNWKAILIVLEIYYYYEEEKFLL